jgi:hypothetical protein
MNKKQDAFEALYYQYWKYVYEFEVGYVEDFEPDNRYCKREDFNQQLVEEGLTIKVNKGY